MAGILKAIGLVDTFKITIYKPKNEIVCLLKKIIDDEKPFSLEGKNKRYKGQVSDEFFSFRLKTRFLQFNLDSDNFTKVSGTIEEKKDSTSITCKIESQARHLLMTSTGMGTAIFAAYLIYDFQGASWGTIGLLLLISLLFGMQQVFVLRKGTEKMKRWAQLELENIATRKS